MFGKYLSEGNNLFLCTKHNEYMYTIGIPYLEEINE